MGSVLLARLVSSAKPEIYRTTLNGALHSRIEPVMPFHAPPTRAARLYDAAEAVLDSADFTTLPYAATPAAPRAPCRWQQHDVFGGAFDTAVPSSWSRDFPGQVRR